MLKPLSKEGWNYETAAHLLNRAGFGGTPEEIARLTDLGHDAALSSLLDYEKIPDPTPNPAWAVPDLGARGTTKSNSSHGAGGSEAGATGRAARPGATNHRIARLVAQPHGQRAEAVSGEDGLVLARPFRHQLRKGPGRVLHVAAKRVVPPTGHGLLAAPAHRGRQGSGDAHLAGPGAKPQGTSE